MLCPETGNERTVFESTRIGFRRSSFHGPANRSGGVNGQCEHSAVAAAGCATPKRETWASTLRYSSTTSSSVGIDRAASLQATASAWRSPTNFGSGMTAFKMGAPSPASAAASAAAADGQVRGRMSAEKRNSGEGSLIRKSG